MNTTYTIIKTILNCENNIDNTKNNIINNTTILGTFNSSTKCIDKIKDLQKILIKDNEYYLVTKIQNTIPTQDDIDGLYLVNKYINTDEEYKIDSYPFKIYLKKTSQLKGYLYNSYDINIQYLGNISICPYNLEIKCNTNINIPDPICKNIDTYSKDNETKTLNFNFVINELKTKLNKLNKNDKLKCE